MHWRRTVGLLYDGTSARESDPDGYLGKINLYMMETFSALLVLCAGNSPVTSWFPSQRPVTQSFDVFFDLRLNKRLG